MSSELVRQWLEEAGARLVKPSGHNLISCCPFHDDHKRSFSMDSTNGRFICFSAWCGKTGGPVQFLMEALDRTYEEAKKEVQDLEESVGVEVGDDGWASIPNRGAIEESEASVSEAELGLYDFCPRYMLGRGFSKEVLQRWEVGYDRDAHKVTFPVRSRYGLLVGLSLRQTVANRSEPKYLHLHFKRREHLYGLHLADKSRELWVGEGQTDALALSQLGLNSVSTMGSRVSSIQVALLSSWSNPIVLAFDDDRDGYAATLKAGDGLLDAGMRDVFVAGHWPKKAADPGDLLKCTVPAIRLFKERLVSYPLWRLETDRVSLSTVIEYNDKGERWKATRPTRQ